MGLFDFWKPKPPKPGFVPKGEKPEKAETPKEAALTPSAPPVPKGSFPTRIGRAKGGRPITRGTTVPGKLDIEKEAVEMGAKIEPQPKPKPRTLKTEFLNLPGIKQLYEFEKRTTPKIDKREQELINKRNETLQRNYNQGKIQVMDLNTNIFRFETPDEYLQRTRGKTITETYIDIVDDVVRRFKGETREERLAKKFEMTEVEKDWSRKLTGALDSFIKFSIFAPYLTTGATKKGEAKVKVKSKAQQRQKLVKITKEQADELSEAIRGRYESAYIKNNLERTLAEDLKTLSRIQDPTKRATALDNFAKLLKNLRNENLLKKDFMFNTQTGQLQFFEKVAEAPTVIAAKPTGELIIDVTAVGAPTISPTAISVTAAAVRRENYTKRVIDSNKKILDTKVKNINNQISNLSKRIAETTSTTMKQSLKNKQKTLQKQKQNEINKFKQLTKQKTRQLQKVSLLQLQKPRLIEKPRVIPRQITIKRIIKKPKLKKPIPIILPKPFSSKKKKLKPKVTPTPKKPLAYYSEVKQAGKWKKILKQPLIEQQARALAQRTADRTIAASARIRPTMKYKKLAKISVKAPKKEKFREYKIRKGKKIATPNTWIEKRKYRLDTPKETQTLKAYKKSAAFKKLLTRSKKK